MTIEAGQPRAMAFFSESYPQAASFAQRFAGEDGRVATIPDVIDARLATSTDKGPWTQYIDTNSAEYFGHSQRENPIIVVAHGVGPLSTPEGLIKAYKKVPRERGRRGIGGRISQKDFLALEDGKFGEVTIVDFNSYVTNPDREYPFIGSIFASDAEADPLVNARLGPRVIEYLRRHRDESTIWADEENDRIARGEVVDFGVKKTRRIGGERYEIIEVSDASNLPYRFRNPDDTPLAMGLTIGQLTIMNGNSLHTEISPREHRNPARLVGIKDEGPIEDIIPSVSIYPETIAKNLDRFLRSVNEERQVPPMFTLQKAGDVWFTQYPKDGARLDSGNVEYVVQDLKPVSQVQEFSTRIGGYYGFFKYGLDEVMAIAPEVANAYSFTGEVRIDGDCHRAPLQFYRADVDTSRYVPPARELESDYENLIFLASQ